MFLVPRVAAPKLVFRDDPTINSFACSAPLLEALGSDADLIWQNIYKVFSHAVRTAISPRLFARQFPLENRHRISGNGTKDFTWIIPHRGRSHYLRECIRTLPSSPPSSIRVAIDGHYGQSLKKFCAERDISAISSRNPPVGPYILRNAMVSLTTTQFAAFQDSDDFSTHDRLHRLRSGFVEPDIGMVGSHEIRVDSIAERIFPIRYPLDVTEALRRGPAHSLLHPTSAVRVSAFLNAGGFSTIARHSMDTHFLLRSYFHFRSRNIDDFLYIRRWRRNSLCTHPKTALDTFERAQILMQWLKDFVEARRAGAIPSTSSLIPRNSIGSTEPYLV